MGEGANRPAGVVMAPVYEAGAGAPPGRRCARNPAAAGPSAYPGRMDEHRMPPQWACVAAGGALGTLARAGLDSAAAARPVGGLFAPWSVLVANVVGALALGALAAFTAARSAAFPERARALARLKLFAGTGFAGAFTTYGGYAAWTVSSAAQWSARAHGAALALAQSAGLLAVGAVAAWAGHRLVSGAQR